MSYLPGNLAFASSPRTPIGAGDPYDEAESEDYDDFDVDDLNFDDDDEDYDGVSVSGVDCEPDENEINLAHRTSEIMEDYRAYLTEVTGTKFSSYPGISSTTSIHSSEGNDEEVDEDVEGGYTNFADRERNESNGGHLHREWSYNGNFHDVPMGTYSSHGNHGSEVGPHDSSSVWIEEEYGDYVHSGRRYKNYKQAHRSKRFRRGIMGLVVACAIIGVISGVSISSKSNSNSKPSHSEDLEAMMTEALQEEKEREDALPRKDGSVVQLTEKDNSQIPPKSTEDEKANSHGSHIVVTEGISPEEIMRENNDDTETHSEVPETSPASSSTKTKSETDHPRSPTMIELQEKDWMEHYEAVAIKYRPRWYDRSKGWNGHSYIDALTFCAKQDSYIPCPYEAYCPSGPLTTPVGGFKDEGEDGSWAPIIDSPNGWVQVSSTNSCMKYGSVHNQPPAWGLSGQDNDEITRHIMCCQEPAEESLEELYDSLEEVKSALDVHVNTEKEQIVLDELHPIWFGREQGYQGTTHSDAVEFCSNVAGLQLCPIEAYCPNGKGHFEGSPLFLNRAPFDGEQWAPINIFSSDSKSENDWVMIGSLSGDEPGTCLTYDQINNKGPVWGLDGSHSEIKQHVMCCLDTSNFLAETKYMETLKPNWIEWSGSTHKEAVEECASINQKICPYAAYCPHGPGKPVAGYHAGDFNSEGEQWAPVNDNGRGTHWIQIGQKHDNILTTCLASNQLEGESIDGGIASKEKSLKKHLMCCD